MTTRRGEVPRFEPIETDRFVVRPVRHDDVEALWRRRNDPATAAYQAWDVPYDRAQAQSLIDAVVAHDGRPPGDGWFQLTVDDRRGSATVADLALRLRFDGRTAEIGYTVATEARGRGVATEAADALVRWCFDTCGVSRVGARMHPDNTASIRVAEHLGMVFEGRSGSSFWLDRADGSAEVSDDVHYGMDRAGWDTWRTRTRSAPSVVRLVEIDHRNVHVALGLSAHRSQRRFASPIEASIADAWRPEPYRGDPIDPWPRLIEADGEIVGFVMLTRPTARHPASYLWRLLVDRMHQRRGIGQLVVDAAVDQARAWGAPAIETSWVPGPGSPEPLYRQAGFEPTGEVDEGEIVARRPL